MFQLYHGERKLIVNEIIIRSALYKTNTLSEFSMVLAHWNNTPRIHMSPKSVTLSWFRTNQSLLFQLKAVYLAGSNEYQFHSLWLDPIGAGTHDLPHSRWARQPAIRLNMHVYGAGHRLKRLNCSLSNVYLLGCCKTFVTSNS
jgi:hypothetical protein